MEIELSKYPEKCHECGSPARTELVHEEYPNDHEWFQFCVNPRCIQFDGSNLRALRESLEKEVRKSKGFRRWRDRLWKAATVAYNKEQKRLRALMTR